MAPITITRDLETLAEIIERRYTPIPRVFPAPHVGVKEYDKMSSWVRMEKRLVEVRA